MNLDQAKAIMKSRLIFGDPTHIEAVELMELARQCVASNGGYEVLCAECDGVSAYGFKCRGCRGAGFKIIGNPYVIEAKVFRATIQHKKELKDAA